MGDGQRARGSVLLGVLATLLTAALVGPAWADQIVLRGGGRIRGKTLPDPKRADRVTVITETGKTPLSFRKTQIERVIAEPSSLDEYVVKRQQMPSTAQAQYDLGVWCEEHKLADLATVHYEAALKTDKSFGPAHQKLGHVLQGDRWLSGDELREAQGLVKYKGRWISKEERDHREALAAMTAAQSTWVRRIRLLRQMIVSGSAEKGRDAEQQLLEIQESEAVAPLVRVFGDDAPAFRMLLDRILGAIPGPEAASALVHRMLFESEQDIRGEILAQLEKRKEPNVVPTLLKALRSSEPPIVNRAAWTLASLRVVSAVPRLIPALITTQYRVVLVPTGGGSSGGFGSITPGLPMGSVSPLIPIGTNGSSVAYMTPPQVGPGVVAYGATQGLFPPYATSTAGLSTASGSRGPTPKVLAYSYQNVEVLAALVKLTGRDFGYDIPTWSRWVSRSFQPDPAPVRQVPQP